MRRRIDWTSDVIAQQAASGNIELLTFSHSAKPMLRDMKCYRAALQLFDSLCFELSDVSADCPYSVARTTLCVTVCSLGRMFMQLSVGPVVVGGIDNELLRFSAFAVPATQAFQI